MILTIRGTSGSGKTTLARRIMAHYPDRTDHYVPGRKQPLFHRFGGPNHARRLRVLGHYNSPTGGADTISAGLNFIYQLAEEGHEAGENVLFEGLLVSSDCNRFAAMWRRGLPVLLITLDTPLAECYASINARRFARAGAGHKVAAESHGDPTRSKWLAARSIMKRLQVMGAPAEYHGRDSAYLRACEVLGLTPELHK